MNQDSDDDPSKIKSGDGLKWTHVGGQGDKWNFGQFDVASLKEWRIIIEATKPESFVVGDIAIDDIQILLHQSCAGNNVTTPAPVVTTTPTQVCLLNIFVTHCKGLFKSDFDKF